MIKESLNRLLRQEDVRKQLIEIRKRMKDDNQKGILMKSLEEDFSIFNQLLQHEDAKVRKNAALILGDLGVQASLDLIFDAYDKEDKLFVRSSYLAAMKQLDYRKYVNALKQQLELLSTDTILPEEAKHREDEIRQLTEMILLIEKPKGHIFTGYDIMLKMVLITPKKLEDITVSQLEDKHIASDKISGGVVVQSDRLSDVLQIRTYKSILLMPWDKNQIDGDCNAMAKALLNQGLLPYLEEMHEGKGAYYFRLDLRTRMNLSEKSKLLRQIATNLEKLSGHQLINSTSHYEIEIRLVENQSGGYLAFLKLYTMKDERFAYRKYSLAASIHPAIAATVVQIGRPFMKEKANVLDPFCGVGTMLIERNVSLKARSLYGTDTFGQAIKGGRANANEAGIVINFINRNFFEFKHEYKFDEIITNMPRRTAKVDRGQIEALYRLFFDKLKEVMADQGVIILYSNEKELLEREIRRCDYIKVLKYKVMSTKDNSFTVVLSFTLTEERSH